MWTKVTCWHMWKNVAEKGLKTKQSTTNSTIVRWQSLWKSERQSLWKSERQSLWKSERPSLWKSDLYYRWALSRQRGAPGRGPHTRTARPYAHGVNRLTIHVLWAPEGAEHSGSYGIIYSGNDYAGTAYAGTVYTWRTRCCWTVFMAVTNWRQGQKCWWYGRMPAGSLAPRQL